MKRFLVTLAALLIAGTALAGTATTSFTVSLTVVPVCFIDSASNVDFGTIASAEPVPPTSIFNVDLRCTTNAPYTIGLDNGVNFSGGRRMTDGFSFINYEILDPTGTDDWGNAFPFGITASGLGAGTAAAAVSHTGAAAVTDAQPYPNGVFTDTVGVVVTF